MKTIIDWLAKEFPQPLVPLIFVLGAFFILLGATTGIPVFDKSIVLERQFQIPSLILGLILLIFSITTAHHRRSDDKEKTDEPPWPSLKSSLSSSQEKILGYFEKTSESNFKVIQTEFQQIAGKELFYRLEQLRLLGFIEAVASNINGDGKIAVIYKMSDKYRTYLYSNLLNKKNTEPPKSIYINE